MKSPKYVIDIMERSHYYFAFKKDDKRCAAGYTIAVKKATPYTQIKTFESELTRLKKWVDRQEGGECHIIHMPTKTHYKSTQIAIVTIFDPVMQHLERFIHP